MGQRQLVDRARVNLWSWRSLNLLLALHHDCVVLVRWHADDLEDLVARGRDAVRVYGVVDIQVLGEILGLVSIGLLAALAEGCLKLSWLWLGGFMLLTLRHNCCIWLFLGNRLGLRVDEVVLDGLVGRLEADVRIVDAAGVHALANHKTVCLGVLALDALDIADWIAFRQPIDLLLSISLRLIWVLILGGITSIFRDSLVDLALLARNCFRFSDVTIFQNRVIVSWMKVNLILRLPTWRHIAKPAVRLLVPSCNRDRHSLVLSHVRRVDALHSALGRTLLIRLVHHVRAALLRLIQERVIVPVVGWGFSWLRIHTGIQVADVDQAAVLPYYAFERVLWATVVQLRGHCSQVYEVALWVSHFSQ